MHALNAIPQAVLASRALLVDARPDLCADLTRALEAAGFVVNVTRDSLSALRLASEDSADVILVGQSADGLDAAQLCSRLAARASERNPAILLMVSANDADLVRRGLENGARDFLAVPAEVHLAGERALFALRVTRDRRELERSRTHLELAQHSGRLGTWLWDPTQRCLSGSAVANELFGFARDHGPITLDDLRGRSASEDVSSLAGWLEALTGGKTVGAFVHRVQGFDDTPFELSLEARPARSSGNPVVLGVVRDMADRRSSQVQVSRGTDELTGLSNRDRFVKELDVALQACMRKSTHLAVLCLDLNQFKAIAGFLSHDAADQLLVQIARRLAEGLREHDLLAHVGYNAEDVSIARIRGDEFTVLMPDLRQAADAVKVGRRILEFLAEPFKVNSQEFFITISIGIASFPSDERTAEELLKCAETAAYCARQQGRNTVLYYSPAMNAKAFERLTLETGLRRALEREELVVYYQPRMDIATGRPVGFEALVRWRHPELGMVSPMQFIPLAEETGLIVPIGAWILEHACQQARSWQLAGLPPIRMAVNLSSVQFRQPDLFESVMGALERSGLEPRWLELELTESLLMQNPENAVLVLERLASQGIHLSIDDFGTGYSSLSYLKRFPIHSLKIDQTFIRELTTNPDDAAIATSIILMGKSLKLRVVAEGVETRSQLSFLRVMQCHEAQGYLFSPPVPADEAEVLLAKVGPLLEDVA